jgi:hypothetical protein
LNTWEYVSRYNELPQILKESGVCKLNPPSYSEWFLNPGTMQELQVYFDDDLDLVMPTSYCINFFDRGCSHRTNGSHHISTLITRRTHGHLHAFYGLTGPWQ